MKKFIILFLSIAIGINASAHRPIEIDQKLLQSFDSSFPNAQEVSWLEITDAYEVSFLLNGIRTRILYPKDETFTRLTRYYKEENFSYPLQLLVKKAYPGKKIFGITEISTISDNSLAVVYYVIIEDSKKWLTIQLDNEGNMLVVNKFRKL